MKIAMIGQKGMPARYGGVERHVHDLAFGLAEIGHDVIVYSRKWYTQSHDKFIDNVKIKHTVSLHTKHLDTITHVFVSTFHAMLENVDTIHYHGVGPALLSWIPRLFTPNIKVVTTFHSIDRYHAKWNFLAKLILRIGEKAACVFAHKTITVSQSLQEYCRNEFKKETRYIPNGVRINEFTGGEEHIKTFGLEKGQYLLMVSRLVPHKGAHLLIEAFRELKRKNTDNEQIKNLKLAIVGGSVYTDDYIKELHRQASVCNDIVFTDFQSGETLQELFHNSKALIHPSLNEGLPITVIEAMAADIPVLVSNIPEHRELVKDIRSLFEENDVEAIKETILDFLELPDEEIEKMVRKNKKHIEKNYTWETIVPQISELYNTPLKEKLTALRPAV